MNLDFELITLNITHNFKPNTTNQLNILNLIRWKNLLMIAFVQLLIKYALFQPFLETTELTITLNGFGFGLLVLSTLCIAAAGNIINDIYDVETDLVNRPTKVIIGKKISEKTAYTLFIALNVIGVLIGFYLSHLVGRSGFFAIFVIISALLYVYASYLKQMLLLGNILISALVGLSILIVGVFELMPVITDQNQATQLTFFKILFDYALFAFLINLVREIIKDLEDVDGDYKSGMNTLPIVIGRDRASKIAFFASLLPLLGSIYYVASYLLKYELFIGYFLVMIIVPLIYIAIKSFNAKTKKHYHHISNMLKLVMLFGMLSLLLYPIVLK
ncbi:geranylgeranylglycerol-phosphate geranylgeranyltransferase [Gelidibacter pelagius]|uniref:Geranylgeranylglycerol-phosphate geranylgeranyltransferase n=1 Tax=Gelidibacter pelagius TaxID=2819985 RepID=A0ABS3SR98_9FLAO|nr:geranylgeranylglycerol-phosphate geranylgeranyltransferase [Gelidibacter pelagius]MBO3098246.1 geranylgeranylglycerol-phosphate geranylgeranyltransferase [Gelidibacter pelagius]